MLYLSSCSESLSISSSRELSFLTRFAVFLAPTCLFCEKNRRSLRYFIQNTTYLLLCLPSVGFFSCLYLWLGLGGRSQTWRREHVLRQAEFAPPTTCPPKAHGFAHARRHVTNLTKTKPAKPACSLSRRNLQVFGVSGIQSLLNWSAIDYCAGIIEQGELHESISHCGIVILIIAQHEYRSSHCAKFSGHGP